MKFRSLPLRIVTGAYILHTGLDKKAASDETAKQLHGFASAAYPQFESLEPAQFAKMLSVGEMALGAALLAPFVPDRLAGAGLTAFSGGLLGMYWKAPRMRKENSIWPSREGMAISKDVWMLGIGLSLFLAGG